MVALTTVTFSKDIHLMLLQAHSVKMFLTNPITHYVYIQDDVIPIETWHQLLNPIYRNHKLVLLNKKYDLFQEKSHGWTDQQYIKLKMASEIPAEYVVSLDSKDLFCTPIDLADVFYGHEGSIGSKVDLYTSDHLEWAKFWRPWITFIDTKYGLKSPLADFPGTPFVFKQENLQKLFKTVDVAGLFLETLPNAILASEYILYNYFADPNLPNSKWQKLINDRHRVTQVIHRRDLDNSNEYRERMRAELYELGFPKNIADNAVNFTTQINR